MWLPRGCRVDGDEQEHTKAAEGAAPDSEAAGRALFTAARGGHADMVSALLAQGTHPDPVWCEDSGLTPLHAAAMCAFNSDVLGAARWRRASRELVSVCGQAQAEVHCC